MRLTDHVCLVGSGSNGMHLTDAYDCNVYLIDGGDELAVVDTGSGMGVEQILGVVEQHGYRKEQIASIILTHAHADHAGGARKMAELTGAKVIAPAVAADYIEWGDEAAIQLAAAKRAGIYPEDYRFTACPISTVVKEGDQIRVGRHVLDVIESPGHCAGHACYCMRADGRVYLFAGDAVFYGGRILVQYIDDCNVKQYGDSLMKLKDLQVDVLLPGHELVVLKNGQRHIDLAVQTLATLGMPRSLF